MLDHVQSTLKSRGWPVQPGHLFWGFSASGMFVNRFTILHPEHVLAAAVGSPGGWPIAPLTHWKRHCLRFPVGICDLEQLAGRPVNMETYRSIPHFFFIGNQDTNDSVPYNDGYEDQDEHLIFTLFGITPIERWAVAEELYETARVNATFKQYLNVGHRPSGFSEITQFFSEAIQTTQAPK